MPTRYESNQVSACKTFSADDTNSYVQNDALYNNDIQMQTRSISHDNYNVAKTGSNAIKLLPLRNMHNGLGIQQTIFIKRQKFHFCTGHRSTAVRQKCTKIFVTEWSYYEMPTKNSTNITRHHINEHRHILPQWSRRRREHGNINWYHI